MGSKSWIQLNMCTHTHTHTHTHIYIYIYSYSIEVHYTVSILYSKSVSQVSRSVVSNSLGPHGVQHARPPCPSPTPKVYSNSCPSSQWCHPTISSRFPLLLPPSIFLRIRVFTNESVLCIRWPKYWPCVKIGYFMQCHRLDRPLLISTNNVLYWLHLE